MVDFRNVTKGEDFAMGGRDYPGISRAEPHHTDLLN